MKFFKFYLLFVLLFSTDHLRLIISSHIIIIELMFFFVLLLSLIKLKIFINHNKKILFRAHF